MFHGSDKLSDSLKSDYELRKQENFLQGRQQYKIKNIITIYTNTFPISTNN